MFLHKIINARMKHGLKTAVFQKTRKNEFYRGINVLYL